MARVLVTSSRMPFALDEIRKLGRSGHEVFVTDTFKTAPGSHSRYAEEAIITPSPRYETAAFLDAIEEIVRSRRIDWLLPTFEEVFPLARARQRFDGRVHLFAAQFEALHALHDKRRFVALAERLGLPVPRTVVARDEAGLAAATREFGEFFARPAYSRGGVQLFTNVGPLAGVLTLDRCHPSDANPWLVQGFVRGTDVCTFSIVHHGRIAAHSTYIHPRMLEHAGGISFEAIDEGGTLAIAAAIAAETGYHGQLSLDFLRTDEGLVLVECNPRPTAGVYLMPDDLFVRALFDPDRGRPLFAPVGAKRRIDVAIIRDMFRHPEEIPEDLAALFAKARDVYAAPDDMMPALFQFLSYSHVLAYRRRRGGRDKRADLMAGYFDDVQWDGEESGAL